MKFLSVGIIGSGPGAFYTALHLIRSRPNVKITIYEKLNQPFGLVKFGVAPDHPEIKNCSHSFSALLASHQNQVSLVTGIEITNLAGPLLSQHQAIVVAAGAQSDKRLNIEGEKECRDGGFGLVRAREFVNWYNGSPSSTGQSIALIESEIKRAQHIAIVGNGNVALDIARIIGKAKMDGSLDKSDISERALSLLKNETSALKRISIVGRRGPLQASFTAKELREFLLHSPCLNILEPNPNAFAEVLKQSLETQLSTAQSSLQLSRQANRIFEIWKNTTFSTASEKFGIQFEFNAEPHRLIIDTALRQLKGLDVVIKNGSATYPHVKRIACSMVISSIGYALKTPLFDLPFEGAAVANVNGKVRNGVYVSGWCKTGPQGDITSTMHSAFETADTILKDFSQGNI